MRFTGREGNDQVQQILGHPFLPAESSADYTRYAAFHPDGRPFLPDEWPLSRSLRSGEVVRGEEILYHRGDGSQTTLRARSAPVRDGSGRITAAVMTFHDISAQKQAAAALRESEARFKAFMDNSSSVAFMKDDQGRMVYVNRPFLQTFQRQAADVLGKSDFDLYPPQVAEPLRAHDLQVLAAGEPMEMIETVPTPDGVLRHWLVIKFPIEEASGRQLLGGVAIDITERLQAEKAIRESEQRFQLIARATNDAVWDRDLAASRIWWNEGLKTIFGYASDESTAAAQWWYDRIHPDDRDRVVAGLNAVIDGGGQYWSDEYRFRRADDTFVHVFDRGYVILDERGKPVRMIGAMMDVTERKRLEEQLRQSQKMEAIGRLAGGVAHDFNNLLTVITGYSELIMLDSGGPTDPVYHKAEEIKKAADRAASLTRQLLAYSRQQVLAPKVLNLNNVVTDMEKMLRRLIGEDIEFATRLDPNLRLVTADPGQIEQVIMNLAVNARDAMPTGGRMTIRTANVEIDEAYAWAHADVQPGAYVLLAVSDTGVGMSDEVRAHLFEPFFTTKEQGKGTGLGLATVYGILKQSGGHIDVETAPGAGTTFKVYLPQVLETAKGDAREALASHLAAGSETVLLVEDEEMVRSLTRAILQKNGYKVLEASHGAEAIRLCEQHHGPIHLVVTDVVMPQLNGHELYQRLLRLRPNLKALFISGYTGESVAQLGVLTEGSEFLQKPFRPDTLVRKVRKMLDGP
jgi:PAS domain S-box-containing protein